MTDQAVICEYQPQHFTGQKARILALLLQNKGQWVPAYESASLAPQYSVRPKELLGADYVIENKTERVGRQVHGSFPLASCPRETESPSFAKGGQ